MRERSKHGRVRLDGGDFAHADLRGKTLVYEGGRFPNLGMATVDGQWSFEGPAANALVMLAYLEKGMPEAAEGLMQAARQQLRSISQQKGRH